MAKKTISQRIALDGGKAIENQLKELGEAGERAFDQIRKAAVKADLAKFGASLNKFGGDLATVGTRIGVAFAGIFAGANLSAAGAAAAVFSLAKSGGEAADASGKAAQAAGLQVDAYGRLQYAAEMADVEQTEFDAGMARLNKTMGDAARGSKIAVNAFQQLGVRIKDANGQLRDPGAVMLDLAQSFSKLPDGARKSALAMDIFGRSGTKLLPFLNSGKQGLIDLGKEAEDLGVVFTKQQAEIGDALGDALDGISTGARGIRLQIGLIFAPAITQAATALLDRIKALRPAIQGFAQDIASQALPVALDFIAALTGDDANVKNSWVIEWRDGVIAFGQSTQDAFVIVLAAFDKFRAALDMVAGGINALFGTNLSGDALGLILLVGQLTGAFRLLWSTILLAKDAAILLFGLARTNPWIAAITAVAGGILLWATRADEATRAMQSHEKVVNDVRGAYDQAGRKVAEMTQEVKDQALIQQRLSQETTGKALSGAIDEAINSIQQFEGLLPHAADELFKIFDQFKQTRDVDAFREAVARIGAANPELGKLAQQFLDISANAGTLSTDAQESANWIALLTGKISDADFVSRQAALGIAGYADAVKPAAENAANDVSKVGAAATDTADKVEAAGKRITVTRFGADGMSKVTYELKNGVVTGAQQAASELEKVGEKGKAAGEKAAAGLGAMRSVPKDIGDAAGDAAANIDTEITNSISKIAPAAGQAASQVSTAFGSIDYGVDAAGEQAQAAADSAISAISTIVGSLTGFGGDVRGTFSTIASLIGQQFQALVSTVSVLISRMEAQLASLRSAIAAAQAQASASGAQSNAAGGHIRGAGTGTSDSILSWLSNGEYVIKAASVRRFGVSFFDMLNRGVLPNLKKLGGFSMGGLVDAFRMPDMQFALPAYAGGGLAAPASGGTPVTLVLDGQKFDVAAPDEVAGKLGRYVRERSMVTVGRRPTWNKG